MIILYILTLLTFIFVNVYKTKRSLHMLQQNLYNENNRYLKWLVKNYRQFISVDLIIIAATIIGMFVIYDLEFISAIVLLAMSLTLTLLGLFWRREIINDQNKKRLVITARIKRLIITTIILYAVPIIIYTYFYSIIELNNSCLSLL